MCSRRGRGLPSEGGGAARALCVSVHERRRRKIESRRDGLQETGTSLMWRLDSYSRHDHHDHTQTHSSRHSDFQIEYMFDLGVVDSRRVLSLLCFTSFFMFVVETSLLFSSGEYLLQKN